MELELAVREEANRDSDRLRGWLIALPVCARCQPIARMRGAGV